MSAISATRNTCFAVISAIEDDLRSLILALAESIGIASNILPLDVRDVAQRRRMSDARVDAISSSDQVNDVDLLPYIDFADISKIIDSRFAAANLEKSGLTDISKSLLALTSTRNRVCHTRPLEPDDLPRTLDLAEYLLTAKLGFPFPMLTTAMSRLKTSPATVLALQIPSFWNAGISQIHNNLPMPEFDETGFLGRSADRMHVSRLLKSHYPVVTIVGEGGIGKTALALRCLYDLLDEQSETGYDAIVWVSMKTATLTQAGIRDLTGAIKSTLGLLSEIATQLGSPNVAASSEDELIDEIVEYLELYRVVVAIDNLETISTGTLRALLERVPAQSKVLLTSRVGVGEFEVRYPLQGLDEKTSISLIRIYSRLLAVSEISRLDDGHIKGFCRKLFNNPLLIKWFVASVGRGAEPTRLLSVEGKDFSSALSFCFENLFDRFGEQEKVVIHCLASARKALSVAEIRFLAATLTDLDAEIALSALHNSSVVSRSKSQGQIYEYSLSESAVKFLNKKFPPSAAFFKDVQSRMRELRGILSHETRIEAVYEYNPFFVRVGESRDEKISATYLRSALDFLKTQELEKAREVVSKSIELTPNYSEAWRIRALIEERAQEFYAASENYEQAIGIDPSSKISRYCYAMFLMTDMDDLEGALVQFTAAAKLDPDAPPLLTAKAMCFMRSGRLEDAAAIHEILLPSIQHRERRWRISGADQAADCFRRLAVTALEMKEYDKSKAYTRRALTILLDAAERSDVDQKLIMRLSKVVQTAFAKQEVITDTEFVELVVTHVERIVGISGRPHISLVLSPDWFHLKSNSLDNHHARLVVLDRRVNRSRDSDASSEMIKVKKAALEPGRMIGNIHNVAVGGRYAFVVNLEGNRWFTHAQFMRHEEDWSGCKQGTPVSFCLGQNAKGPCAVDVCVLTEGS